MKEGKLPEESRLVGNFGEYALAFFLTKCGVNVMRVDTVFFDLVAKDQSGYTFEKNKIVGISVKLRDRTNSTPTCTIQHKDFKNIDEYGKKWGIEPWICHMIVFMEKDKRYLEAFLFKANDSKKYFAEAKREYAISFSKLRGCIGRDFIDNKNYFRWLL